MLQRVLWKAYQGCLRSLGSERPHLTNDVEDLVVGEVEVYVKNIFLALYEHFLSRFIVVIVLDDLNSPIP